METGWWYADGGKNIGPLPLSDLLRRLSDDQITLETLVWQKGWDGWHKLADVKEIQPQIVEALREQNRRIHPPLPQPGGTSSTSPPNAIASSPAATRSHESPAMSVALYAGFWKRLGAMILDYLIVVFIAFVIGLVIGIMFAFGSKGSNKFFAEALSNLAGLVVSWLYFALMESSTKQATLGKIALGIKVVDLQGNRISFGRASGRFFGKIVSGVTFGIGYVMAAFTKRKQALHDMIASCLVVNKAVTSSELQHSSAATGMSTGAIVALVIVGALVPITGILAAIAIPTYQDYANRAKMAEVVIIGVQATKAVEDFIAKNNAIPMQIEQTGFTATSPYVKRVIVNGESGVVLLTTGFLPVTDKTLTFAPSLDQNKTIVWKCTSEDIPARYLPQRCR